MIIHWNGIYDNGNLAHGAFVWNGIASYAAIVPNPRSTIGSKSGSRTVSAQAGATTITAVKGKTSIG
jgi:hypothetical protein